MITYNTYKTQSDFDYYLSSSSSSYSTSYSAVSEYISIEGTRPVVTATSNYTVTNYNSEGFTWSANNGSTHYSQNVYTSAGGYIGDATDNNGEDATAVNGTMNPLGALTYVISPSSVAPENFTDGSFTAADIAITSTLATTCITDTTYNYTDTTSWTYSASNYSSTTVPTVIDGVTTSKKASTTVSEERTYTGTHLSDTTTNFIYQNGETYGSDSTHYIPATKSKIITTTAVTTTEKTFDVPMIYGTVISADYYEWLFSFTNSPTPDGSINLNFNYLTDVAESFTKQTFYPSTYASTISFTPISSSTQLSDYTNAADSSALTRIVRNYNTSSTFSKSAIDIYLNTRGNYIPKPTTTRAYSSTKSSNSSFTDGYRSNTFQAWDTRAATITSYAALTQLGFWNYSSTANNDYFMDTGYGTHITSYTEKQINGMSYDPSNANFSSYVSIANIGISIMPVINLDSAITVAEKIPAINGFINPKTSFGTTAGTNLNFGSHSIYYPFVSSVAENILCPVPYNGSVVETATTGVTVSSTTGTVWSWTGIATWYYEFSDFNGSFTKLTSHTYSTDGTTRISYDSTTGEGTFSVVGDNSMNNYAFSTWSSGFDGVEHDYTGGINYGATNQTAYIPAGAFRKIVCDYSGGTTTSNFTCNNSSSTATEQNIMITLPAVITFSKQEYMLPVYQLTR